MFHSNATLSLAFLIAITTSCNCPAQLVLIDDFNDGNYNGWTVQSGTWTVNSGTLVGHQNSPGLDAYIYTGSTSWSNFVFETDVIFQDGNANIMFRSTGHWQNEYRLGLYSQVAEAYTNRFFFNEYNNGVVTVHTLSLPDVVAGNAMSPVPIPETAHVKIEAIGSLLSFYINDELMYQFNDPTPLQTGQIGLGTIWNWTDGFDNVSVTLIPEANVVWSVLASGIAVAVAGARRARGRRQQKTIGCPAK